MKSTFGQITAADLKKGFSRIMFQLESDASVLDSVLDAYLTYELKGESEKIVKQILKPRKRL